jgi:hypothetical protein
VLSYSPKPAYKLQSKPHFDTTPTFMRTVAPPKFSSSTPAGMLHAFCTPRGPDSLPPHFANFLMVTIFLYTLWNVCTADNEGHLYGRCKGRDVRTDLLRGGWLSAPCGASGIDRPTHRTFVVAVVSALCSAEC